MKKNILYKIILIAGLFFTATILNAEPYVGPNPTPLGGETEAPLDSMMFLPITVAVGLVVFMTKRKKNKNE